MRFFNPRVDEWTEHFVLEGSTLKPLTAIGEATAAILQFNVDERLLERQILRATGRYPSLEALKRMS